MLGLELYGNDSNVHLVGQYIDKVLSNVTAHSNQTEASTDPYSKNFWNQHITTCSLRISIYKTRKIGALYYTSAINHKG